MNTVLGRFQNSFREALPERNRKEIERSAQRRSEDAQTTLRGAQRTLRGRSEDVQMADWQRYTSNTEVDRNRTPAPASAPAPALATEPFWARVPGKHSGNR